MAYRSSSEKSSSPLTGAELGFPQDWRYQMNLGAYLDLFRRFDAAAKAGLAAATAYARLPLRAPPLCAGALALMPGMRVAVFAHSDKWEDVLEWMVKGK